MKLINKLGLVMVFAASAFLFSSCDKTKLYENTIPAPEVHFVGPASRSIQIVDDPVPVFNLQVGTTDVSSQDRIVTYKVTSTSAVAGTDYTIATGAPTGTVTIPAGQAIANIPIQAIFAAYPIDAVDTLYFTLSEPSITPAKFQDTVRVIIKGPSSSSCDESNPNMSDLLGVYQTTEVLSGNPPYNYETEISSAVLTGPTTAKIGVDNVWDNGWETIYFTLDWSTLPGTAVVVSDDSIAGSDGGDLNSAYAGMTMQVRPHSNGINGTFSVCGSDGPTFTLRMQLGITGLGWFSNTYDLTLVR